MIRYINILKIFLLATAVVAMFITTTREGLYMAAAIFIPLWIIYAIFDKYLDRWQYRELLKEYAVRIDNVYEHSHYPGDREVRKRAQEHIRLLEVSGNQEFLKGNITVYALFYEANAYAEELTQLKREQGSKIQPYLAICPTFDRFLEIVEEFAETDKAQHHKNIARETVTWYLDNGLNQL